MWRKIIEKMYDPVDSEILEEKFMEQIFLREEVSNYICNGLSHGITNFPPNERISENRINQFLTFNKINLQYVKKMAREDIINILRRNQGKLLYSDFQKIILDFQL